MWILELKGLKKIANSVTYKAYNLLNYATGRRIRLPPITSRDIFSQLNMASQLLASVYNYLSLGNVFLLLLLLFLLHYLMVLYEFRNMPPGPRLTTLPVLGNIFSLDHKAERFPETFRRSVPLVIRKGQYGGVSQKTNVLALSLRSGNSVQLSIPGVRKRKAQRRCALHDESF